MKGLSKLSDASIFMASPAVLLAMIAFLTFFLHQIIKFLRLKKIVDKIHGPIAQISCLGNYLDLHKDPTGKF